MLVGVSDPGLRDSFKEAGALARHLADARGSSESELVRELAQTKGTGFGLIARPKEVEEETLESLRTAATTLRAKAPDELPAYREFVLSVARSVGAAASGGDEAEARAVARIEEALGEPADAG
jgi:hypothetical protein